VWLVGGDCASGVVVEGGLLGVAAGTDVVIVDQHRAAKVCRVCAEMQRF
jgi:hypothetical protein